MHENITTEELKALYKGSTFELTSKAIHAAQQEILSGKEVSINKVLKGLLEEEKAANE